MKALNSQFSVLAANEKGFAASMERAAAATKMPDNADRGLAFQSESFATSLTNALKESLKDMGNSHSMSQKLLLNPSLPSDAIAETYNTKIIEPLREIKGQVKGLYREVYDSRSAFEKERVKDLKDIRALHKSLTDSLAYFTKHKGIHPICSYPSSSLYL